MIGFPRQRALAPLQVESYTLRVTEATADAFAFEVHGSRTGFDGRGRFALGKLQRSRFGVLDFTSLEGDVPERFVSNSRRIVIDHRERSQRPASLDRNATRSRGRHARSRRTIRPAHGWRRRTYSLFRSA